MLMICIYLVYIEISLFSLVDLMLIMASYGHLHHDEKLYDSQFIL